MLPALKAATGVDALTHAIEGYTTRPGRMGADRCIAYQIHRNYCQCCGTVAGEKEAGETMVLRQYVAGMGFSNVGLGLVHGMAYPLGVFYNTRYGVANAILLPHVMRFNSGHTYEKLCDIARVIGKKVEGLSLDRGA